MVATDAILTKAQCKRLAVMAYDGYARAIWPVHTPLDGDTIFAAATGKQPLTDPVFDLALIGSAVVATLARACARAVFEASALPYPAALPAWRATAGRSCRKPDSRPRCRLAGAVRRIRTMRGRLTERTLS